jgi:tetratricopeptide (TPR) repeat protein
MPIRVVLICILLDAALLSLGARVALAQESAAEHFNAGYRHETKGEVNKAADEYEIAFGISPDAEKIHFHLGKVLVGKASTADYRRVIELFGDLETPTASSLYWLGRAYQELGQNGDALKQLEKIRDMSEPNLKYVKLAEVDEAIAKMRAGMPPPVNGQPWWVNLLVLVVIVSLSVGAVVALRRWGFVGAPADAAAPPATGPGRGHYALNVVLFSSVALLLVFGALAMGWIEGDQFVDLFKGIVAGSAPKAG